MLIKIYFYSSWNVIIVKKPVMEIVNWMTRIKYTTASYTRPHKSDVKDTNISWSFSDLGQLGNILL